MNIYFTGYMASGKTYIGTLLAQKLDVPFFDLDALIVQKAGQSIAEIFASDGEPAFRQIESEVLRSVSGSANAIVSCGGGTFCSPENRDWIKEQGISIYLQVSVLTLYTRLSDKAESRPIIQANNASKKELLGFIENHLTARQADYELADIIYQADGDTEEMIEELATYFWRFLKK